MTIKKTRIAHINDKIALNQLICSYTDEHLTRRIYDSIEYESILKQRLKWLREDRQDLLKELQKRQNVYEKRKKGR